MNTKPTQIDRVLRLASRHERSVIGMILSKPSVLDTLVDVLRPEHFADESLGKLYSALLDVRGTGGAINQETVVNIMQRQFQKVAKAKLRREASADEISEFRTHWEGWIERYCKDRDWNSPGVWSWAADKVVEGFRLRQLLLIRDRIGDMVEDRTAKAADIADCVANDLLSLETLENQSDTMSLSQSIRQIAVSADQQKELPFVRFGVGELDRQFGAMVGGTLTVIAARPGVGKTIFAMQIALYNSELAKSLLFVSLEMTHEQLAERFVTAKLGIPSGDLKRKRLDETEKAKIKRLADEYFETPFTVFAPAEARVARIASKARQLATSETGLSAIIVDYLGLVTPSDRRSERRDQVGQIAKDLRIVGKEMGVPVIVLAQLNREAAKGGPPLPSQIADSDQVQRHADTIVMIHREEGDTYQLRVVKNRSGPTGLVNVKRDAAGCKFVGAGDERYDEFASFA